MTRPFSFHVFFSLLLTVLSRHCSSPSCYLARLRKQDCCVHGQTILFFASFLFYFVVGSLGTCLFFNVTQPVGTALLFAGCIRQDDCPNQTELEFYLTLFEGINTIWIYPWEFCKFVYRIISWLTHHHHTLTTYYSFRPLRLRKIKRSMLKAILDSGATTNLVRRCLFGDTILAAGLDVDLALGAVGQGC